MSYATDAPLGYTDFVQVRHNVRIVSGISACKSTSLLKTLPARLLHRVECRDLARDRGWNRWGGMGMQTSHTRSPPHRKRPRGGERKSPDQFSVTAMRILSTEPATQPTDRSGRDSCQLHCNIIPRIHASRCSFNIFDISRYNCRCHCPAQPSQGRYSGLTP